ncbi:N-acetylglutamate kinase [Spirosomataceae bacterium TFI 002]|nr:N-acetylglutamate kinase [Spirosomataceae bacterium TFI 002]
MTINIIKIGGNIINDSVALSSFLKDFAKLKGLKVLVHGGGKIATEVALKLDIETKMVEGRRITDAAMIEVVTMVYGGLINKKIVAELQTLGCNAIGLTGADAGLIKAHKRPVKTIDYGFVGDVDEVDGEKLSQFIQMGLSPVFAPLTFDPAHGMLNTNADTQASEIARSLSKLADTSLTYCFEKKGVLSNVDDEESVIPTIDPVLYAKLKAEGVIFEGMIPKLDNAFDAIKAGVKKVIICRADDLLWSVEKKKTGTRLVP